MRVEVCCEIGMNIEVLCAIILMCMLPVAMTSHPVLHVHTRPATTSFCIGKKGGIFKIKDNFAL